MACAFQLILAKAFALVLVITSSPAQAGTDKQASWAPDARLIMLKALREQGMPPDLSEIALRALLDTATRQRPAGRTDHGPYSVTTDGNAASGRCTPVSVDTLRRDTAEKVRFETVACHGRHDGYWRNEKNSRVGGHITAIKGWYPGKEQSDAAGGAFIPVKPYHVLKDEEEQARMTQGK